jgi:hypothetical protein
MNRFNVFLLLLCLFLFSNSAKATTIVPFPNLGEMAKASEAVVLINVVDHFTVTYDNAQYFRSELEVLETIKGELQPGDLFDLQNMRIQYDDLERIAWGDLEMELGHQYLLFLDYNDNGYWQAKMMSYAAFELMERDQQRVLVPFGLGAEVQVTVGRDGVERDPLRVFKATELQQQLRAYLRREITWDLEKVSTPYAIQSFQTAAEARMARPDHCTFVFNTLPTPRWQDFETNSLPVYTESGGDNGCSQSVSKVQNGINSINNQYSGVNLQYAGTHNFVPNCSGGNAAGGNYTSSFATRSVGIQFDDPCSQIANLSGCSGVLAVGGLYAFSSTHQFNGETWRNAAWGYVIVNNGTGACQCDGSLDYDAMIIHEMTHTLNVGHISFGAGAANMNPSCCNLIQPLDIECLDYMYIEEGSLPVELSNFQGRLKEDQIKLEWQTALEISNDYFTLERSLDGLHFEAIGKVSGQGTTSESSNYTYVDRSPRQGVNYYRLVQTDYDGAFEILPTLVSVDYAVTGNIKVMPNPMQGEELNVVYPSLAEGELEVMLFGTNGQLVYKTMRSIFAGRNEFSLTLDNLLPGVYTLQLVQGENVEVRRVVKL